MRCSRTRAPSLHRHYPASAVLQAPPPPCRPDLTLAGCRLARATPPDRASRVASIPLFHACCRHYPGGAYRCTRRSLPDRWQPSPFPWRVGFRITRFEACSAFTRVAARMVAEPPLATHCTGVLQTMLLPPPSAPTATGWSDSCRAGFAPAEEWRLSRRTRKVALNGLVKDWRSAGFYPQIGRAVHAGLGSGRLIAITDPIGLGKTVFLHCWRESVEPSWSGQQVRVQRRARQGVPIALPWCVSSVASVQ